MSCEVALGLDAVHVCGEMTIYAAAELKNSLSKAVQSSQLRQIDLSGVSEFDTTGLQILMILRRDSIAAGEPVALVNASPSVLDCMKLLRVDEELLSFEPLSADKTHEEFEP